MSSIKLLEKEMIYNIPTYIVPFYQEGQSKPKVLYATTGQRDIRLLDEIKGPLKENAMCESKSDPANVDWGGVVKQHITTGKFKYGPHCGLTVAHVFEHMVTRRLTLLEGYGPFRM